MNEMFGSSTFSGVDDEFRDIDFSHVKVGREFDNFDGDNEVESSWTIWA